MSYAARWASSFPGSAVRLWQNYSRVLDQYPITVKSITSVVGFAAGDGIAQAFTRPKNAPFVYDWHRTARMCLFGGLIAGPLGHFWYKFLDRNIMIKDPKGVRAVVTKVALDQLAFAPASTFMFYAYLCTAEGRPSQYPQVLREKYWPSLIAGWKLWPAAHVINFALVPPQQRILYANVVSVLGTFILSRIANDPVPRGVAVRVEPLIDVVEECVCEEPPDKVSAD